MNNESPEGVVHMQVSTIGVDSASVWAKCGPCVGIRRADLQKSLVNACQKGWLDP